MMADAALGQSERVTEIRLCTAKGLTASADIFAKRFEQEMKAGRLTRTPSAKVRGRAPVDLLQGLQLRAKVGIARTDYGSRGPRSCLSRHLSGRAGKSKRNPRWKSGPEAYLENTTSIFLIIRSAQ
jgi:hypothetical protein